jgi:uncharacterized protein (TIGR00369 family)
LLAMSTDLLAVGRRVLAEQPFNRLVGARLTAFGADRAVLEIEIDDRHRQQHGLVHGGVLSYAADNVLTFAAGTVLGPGIVTSGLTIHYLRAAREGVLRATGTVAQCTGRQATCTATLETITSDGVITLCAIASGTAVATGKETAGAPGAVARRLYDALAAADLAALEQLLTADFAGDVSRGMPLGVGGVVHGPTAMIGEVWGRVAGAFDAAPHAEEILPVSRDRVVVLGHYRGRARTTGRAYEAAFAHDIVVREDRIASLTQITDTVPWHQALA